MPSRNESPDVPDFDTEGEAAFLRKTLAAFIEDARFRSRAESASVAFGDTGFCFTVQLDVPVTGEPANDPSDAVDNVVEAVERLRGAAPDPAPSLIRRGRKPSQASRREGLTIETNHDHGTLHNYDTGEALRPATAEELAASDAEMAAGRPEGVIIVDGRRCYVVP